MMPRMSIKWISAAAVVALILAGCAHKGADIDIKATNRDNAPAIPPPSGGFDPGTASVMAAVMTCAEGNNDFVCTFRIDQVQGAGPATPPLVVGQEVRITISTRLTDKNAELIKQLHISGKTFDLMLEYEHPAFGNESVRGWRAVRISPNPNQR